MTKNIKPEKLVVCCHQHKARMNHLPKLKERKNLKEKSTWHFKRINLRSLSCGVLWKQSMTRMNLLIATIALFETEMKESLFIWNLKKKWFFIKTRRINIKWSFEPYNKTRMNHRCFLFFMNSWNHNQRKYCEPEKFCSNSFKSKRITKSNKSILTFAEIKITKIYYL